MRGGSKIEAEERLAERRSVHNRAAGDEVCAVDRRRTSTFELGTSALRQDAEAEGWW